MKTRIQANIIVHPCAVGQETCAATQMLKCNKYVRILSIAVTTLLYITISMITIFSMYITHVHLGSGHNSYQGHVNDSGEF